MTDRPLCECHGLAAWRDGKGGWRCAERCREYDRTSPGRRRYRAYHVSAKGSRRATRREVKNRKATMAAKAERFDSILVAMAFGGFDAALAEIEGGR